MLVYDNGKSAVRVLPGVYAKSVHLWGLPDVADDQRGHTRGAAVTNSAGEGSEVGAETGAAAASEAADLHGNARDGKPRSRTALADPRSLNVAALRPCTRPCVLHFVTCGLEWLKDKYEILGESFNIFLFSTVETESPRSCLLTQRSLVSIVLR